ncbi:hypothetical protein STENM223S_01339 [Streptomyces tendae]
MGRTFAALREDQPLTAPKPKPKGPAPVRVPVDPKQIHVQVENGTHTPGLGKRVDDALAATGFRTTRAPRNAADRALEQEAVVAFDPRWDQSAKSLAAALPGSTLKPVKGQGATLKVIWAPTSRGWRGCGRPTRRRSRAWWCAATRWSAATGDPRRGPAQFPETVTFSSFFSSWTSFFTLASST